MTSTVTRHQWHHAVLAEDMAMSPPPCRMLVVDVFKNNGGGHFVSWAQVVGFICVLTTEYSKKSVAHGEPMPTAGATHEEMTQLGWCAESAGWFSPDCFPVVVADREEDGDVLRVADGGYRDKASNRIHRAVVACDWPPSEDRANAVRIGRGLMDGTWQPCGGASLDD